MAQASFNFSPIQTAEVVIIGGGVMGTSIAWNLAQRGCTDIIIIEQNLLGSGSTSRAAGGIRQQFSSPANIRIGMYSVDFFSHFHQRLELEPDEGGVDFKQCGYLFLVTDAEDLAVFQRNAALQQSLGAPVELLSPQQVAEKWPWLYVDDVIGATYCPTDGYGNTAEVVQSFAKQAKRRGVKIWEETAVKAVYRDGRKLLGVDTDRGMVAANIVIGCAGAWSGILGKMMDVTIPVEPVKRQAFFTEPFPDIQGHVPFVIDMLNGFHFRREGPGFLLGESDESQLPGFETTLDWGWLDTVVEHALHRVPDFERAGILSGWAGLYDTSPDHNGIVGKVPELDNFYLATGFSGHGYMQSPAIGRAIAEMILDGASTSLDVAELSIERFRAGKFNKERNVI